ncbi:hypothetical protein EMIHUDRAFT_435111, partial [Emiliania huxleyi CCMP1516]|uniref:Ankyrin repeat domain-containing protein n=2 Tax=Emiliania huxleyi TaxID=2903 RepID=A0A0D3JSV0_EMIH1
MKSGWTVLHCAAHHGAPRETVEKLVAAGAEVDAVDRRGRTALHEAASAGEVEVAEVLVDLGADPTRKSKAALRPHTPSSGRHSRWRARRRVSGRVRTAGLRPARTARKSRPARSSGWGSRSGSTTGTQSTRSAAARANRRRNSGHRRRRPRLRLPNSRCGAPRNRRRAAQNALAPPPPPAPPYRRREVRAHRGPRCALLRPLRLLAPHAHTRVTPGGKQRFWFSLQRILCCTRK